MRNFFTFLVLCMSLTAFAQINFESGYYIDNNGNKTECLIKNVAWKNNPVSFEYRQPESTATQTVYIKDVKEFSVAGYRFIKYSINIDRSSRDLNQLSEVKAPEYKQETLFLKVLIEGNATLYKYEDGNLVRYFYSTNNQEPVQLVYKPYKVDQSLAYNNEFRGQLYQLMRDKIKPEDVKNLKYEQKPLLKLFTQYNGYNSNSTINYTESQNKSTFGLKFTPGFMLNMLTVKQPQDRNNNVDFGSKPGFRIGIEAELVFPFNNNKWSLFTDPNYYSYSQKNTYIVDEGTPYQNNRTWTADFSIIEIPVGVRHYMYLNQNNKLFLNVAYIVALPMGKKEINYTSEGYQDYGMQTKITSTSGFSAGAGFASGKFSVEGRFNFSKQLMHNYVYWSGELSSFVVIAGYRFL